ncbi:MAG: hypothetical protein F4046_09600, partial [Acidimicrobiaceae bacterium]|nr:hypothetical protein [Acidimicrobiaceae bacterium]
MTPQHAQSSGGGSAGRAIVLVVVAVALGAFLLARGFDDSDDSTEASPVVTTGEPANGDPEAPEPNGTTTT